MLSTSVLPAHAYNDLTTLRDVPSEKVLAAIRRIFQAHNVRDDVGISVVHRHFELETNQVMLHDTFRCAPTCPEDAQHSALEGEAFALQNGTWQAYEFCSGGPLDLGNDFLTELRDYLVSEGMEDKLALKRLRAGYDLLVEYEVPSIKGCVLEV